MSDEKIWLNGRLVPAAEATVSVSDSGFLHGASTFTTMRAHAGRVFRLDRHLARLLETVGTLQIRTDATAETLAWAVAEVLAANELREARVRVTLTPGPAEGGTPTSLVTASALPDYPAWWYEKGVMVIVSPLRQQTGDPTFGNKTGCYLPRLLARQTAAAAGAEEALWYTTDNRLAEACFCNVFLVAEGTVRTPPLDTPVLDGIVRQAVLELCQALDLPHQAGEALTVHDLLGAEEMFLTSSCAGVRPVVAVERHVVGKGEVGPVTRRIMEAYAELLERECTWAEGPADGAAPAPATDT